MKQRVPTKVVIVLVTCPTRAVARQLAKRVVERQLAACVNAIEGVESTFIWKGKTERCRETLLVIKTTAKSVGRLKRTILTLHPYDVPEIIALPVVSGYQPYLQWVASGVSSS